MENSRIIDDFEAWFRLHMQEFITDLCSLIRIKSVSTKGAKPYPFGKEAAEALDFAVRFAKRAGLAAENDDYYTVSVLLKGESRKELGILGHLDVVPAGEGWETDPFQGILKEGYIIGRGALDDKGICLAVLYLLSFLREKRVSFRHTIRVILGTDEEMGMRDVEHYRKTHEKLPVFTIVCDCFWGVCVGEKGHLDADYEWHIKAGNLIALHAGAARNAVPETAYAILSGYTVRELAPLNGIPDIRIAGDPQGVRIEAKGVSAHAAFPEHGRNAIYLLCDVLLSHHLVDSQNRRLIKFLHTSFQDFSGKGMGIDYQDEISGGTTVTGSLLRTMDGRIYQHIDVRYAVSDNGERILESLKKHGEAYGANLINIEDSRPRYDDPDKEIVKTMTRICEKHTGKRQKPYVMGGGTHARKFPGAFPFGPSDRTRETLYGKPHGANEAVELEELITAARIYLETLMEADALFDPF